MGCDIHGCIEVEMYKDSWYKMADLGAMLGRNYNMFSYFFGVRTYTDFEGKFTCRGEPTGLNGDTAKEISEWESDCHSVSYMTWLELKEILESEEWNSQKTLNAWISEYRVDDDEGKLSYKSSYISSSKMPEDTEGILPKGGALFSEDGKTVFRREFSTPKDMCSRDWFISFNTMKFFAKNYGDDKVRMVVYFDN